jgi:hypothetical protein
MEIAIEEYRSCHIKGTEFIVWILQSIQQVARIESAETDVWDIEPIAHTPPTDQTIEGVSSRY